MASVILKNIVDLSINDVNDLCPECNSTFIESDQVFGGKEPQIPGDWLRQQKEFVNSGKQDMYVLLDTEDSCAPVTMVRISYSDQDPKVGKLESWGAMYGATSGLAAASCQFAISQAFKSGRVSRITTQICVKDFMARGVYALALLVESPPQEGVNEESFANDDLTLTLDSHNPAISEWKFEQILNEADVRLHYAKISTGMARDLFQISTPFDTRGA